MRSLVRVVTLGVIATAVVPLKASAQPVPAVVAASMVDAKCRDFAWKGAIGKKVPDGTYFHNSSKPVGATGTVRTCMYVYKVKDAKNRKHDWYMTAMTSEWKRRTAGSHYLTSRNEPWSVRLRHSKPAQDKVYEATATYKKPISKTSFSVGLSWGVAGISVPVEITDSLTVKRENLGRFSAKWSCPRISGLKSTAMVYGSKVKQGKKRPVFTADFSYPHYVYKYKKVDRVAAGGVRTTGWKIVKTASKVRTATFTI